VRDAGRRTKDEGGSWHNECHRGAGKIKHKENKPKQRGRDGRPRNQSQVFFAAFLHRLLALTFCGTV